jgi:hypothetical protein
MDSIKTTHSESGLFESVSSLLLVGLLVACGALVYWGCILK